MSYRYRYGHSCSKPHSNDSETTSADNEIRIETTINLTQNANANGGDGGDGGDTGETGDITGGSAASADSSDGFAIAINAEDIEIETSDGEDDLAQMGLNNLPGGGPINGNNPDNEYEDSATATSTGGDAVGPSGGNGGAGGAGGTATNTATIVSENVIVINTSSEGATPPTLTLGLNNRQIDITADENGDPLVNGQSMTANTLEDGTKVFILKNTI